MVDPSSRVLPPIISVLPSVQRQEFRIMVQETLGDALAASLKLSTESSSEVVIDKLLANKCPLLKACFTRFFSQEADETCFDASGPATILKSLFFSLFLAISRYHSLEPYSCHFLPMADWYIMANSPVPGNFGEVARDPLALSWFDQWNTLHTLSDKLRTQSLDSTFTGMTEFAPLFKEVKTPFAFVKKLRMRSGLKPTFELPRPEFLYTITMKKAAPSVKSKPQRSVWANLSKPRPALAWITDIMNSRGALSTKFAAINEKEISSSSGIENGVKVQLPSLFTGDSISPSVPMLSTAFFIFWHVASNAYRILPLNMTSEASKIKILKVWNAPKQEESKEEKKEENITPPPAAKPPLPKSNPSPRPPPVSKAVSFAPSFEDRSDDNRKQEEADNFYVQSKPKKNKEERRDHRKSSAKRPPSSSDSSEEEKEEDSFIRSKSRLSKKRSRSESGEEDDEGKEESDEEDDDEFDLRKTANRKNDPPESRSLDSNESRDADSDEMEEIDRLVADEEREGYESGIVVPDEFDREELDIFDQLNDSDRMLVMYSSDKSRTLRRLGKKKGLKPLSSDDDEEDKEEKKTKAPEAKRHKTSESKSKTSSSDNSPAIPDKIYYNSLAPGYVAESGALYTAFISLLNVAALVPSTPELDSAWLILQKAINDYTDLSSRGRVLRDPKDSASLNFGSSKRDARLVALLNLLLEKNAAGGITIVDPGCPTLRSKFLTCIVMYCKKIADNSDSDPVMLVEFERQTEVWKTTKSVHQLLQYMMADDIIFKLARILMGGCVTLGNHYVCLKEERPKE